MNFIICGLPRSGTTILTRFIGGLPGVLTFHEPMQTFAKYASLPTAAQVTPGMPLQIGFKEPYLSYPPSAAFYNIPALHFLKWSGVQFVFIVRLKVAQRKALREWNWPEESIDFALEDFRKFVGDSRFLRFEDFCEDPIGAWNAYDPIGVRATEIRLAPVLDPFVGDAAAKNAETISCQ